METHIQKSGGRDPPTPRIDAYDDASISRMTCVNLHVAFRTIVSAKYPILTGPTNEA